MPTPSQVRQEAELSQASRKMCLARPYCQERDTHIPSAPSHHSTHRALPKTLSAWGSDTCCPHCCWGSDLFCANSPSTALLPPHLLFLQVDGAQAQVDKVHIHSILHKADDSLVEILCMVKVLLQVAQVPFLSPDVWILCTKNQE